MKKTIFPVVLICALFSFFGCSYKAHVPSTSAPVAEIRSDKQMDYSASYYIGDEISNLNKQITPSSYVCSAHTFPLSVSQGLQNSIIKVLEGTFKSVNRSSTTTPSAEDGKYKFIFSLDSFNPSLRFATGFWEASIFARSELIMKVKVVDKDGKEVVRTTISGDGAADSSGHCGDGAQVLADATQKSIKRVLENFVYKVINSDYLAKK